MSDLNRRVQISEFCGTDTKSSKLATCFEEFVQMNECACSS